MHLILAREKKQLEFEEGERISFKLTADDEDEDDMEFSLVSTDGKVKKRTNRGVRWSI